MKQKRPLWVWIIFIFTLLGVTLSAWSFYAIESGSVPLNDTQNAYFNDQGPLDWGVTILSMSISTVAALMLLMLKKVAVPLYLTGLILSFLSAAYYALSTPWLEASGTSGIIGTVVGFGISIVIYLYAKSLRDKGILT